MPKVKVIIFAGGQGMRLKDRTEFRPKPMVEIGGRPIIWHIMKHYAHYGFTDFVICLGFLGEVVKEYFLNFDFVSSDFTITLGDRNNIVCHSPGNESGWTITLADTGLYSETGSRLKQIEKYTRDCDLMMVTYGDGVSDVNLREALDFHLAHGKIGTVTGVSPPSRFGELISDSSQVMEFSEKPQVSKGYINGGFFIFDKRVFSYVSADPSCNFEKEPLSNLAKDGQLMMFHHSGFWHCLDTMRDLISLNDIWDKGNAPWMTWEEGAKHNAIARP